MSAERTPRPVKSPVLIGTETDDACCDETLGIDTATQFGVAVGVDVGVFVGVCVTVGVAVSVLVSVFVGVLVTVAVGVIVGVLVTVDVFVGVGETSDEAPFPTIANSYVPP